MDVIGIDKITAFGKKHPNAKKPLEKWLAKARHAQWRHFADIRKTFSNSADPVQKFVVFNISGNNFRLAAIVIYTGNTLIIDKIMTHKEYERWSKILRSQK